MIQQTDTPVHRTITVAASQERAFSVFTEQFGTWWPKDYHIGEADLADFVVEPKIGGRWYEVGVDGTQCDTGRVIVYEPPSRLTLAWQLNGAWRYDPDPAHASEVKSRCGSSPRDQNAPGSNWNTAGSSDTATAQRRSGRA